MKEGVPRSRFALSVWGFYKVSISHRKFLRFSGGFLSSEVQLGGVHRTANPTTKGSLPDWFRPLGM